MRRRGLEALDLLDAVGPPRPGRHRGIVRGHLRAGDDLVIVFFLATRDHAEVYLDGHLIPRVPSVTIGTVVEFTLKPTPRGLRAIDARVVSI